LDLLAGDLRCSAGITELDELVVGAVSVDDAYVVDALFSAVFLEFVLDRGVEILGCAAGWCDAYAVVLDGWRERA
jgi:hypothetical protein